MDVIHFRIILFSFEKMSEGDPGTSGMRTPGRGMKRKANEMDFGDYQTSDGGIFDPNHWDMDVNVSSDEDDSVDGDREQAHAAGDNEGSGVSVSATEVTDEEYAQVLFGMDPQGHESAAVEMQEGKMEIIQWKGPTEKERLVSPFPPPQL